MASPTHHLDSYEGMCWPADHPAALASLVLHDKLYKTNYTPAYNAWKLWTLDHLDPLTSMPMGYLSQKSGHQIEPARGCANSVMIAILMEIDPVWARDLYARYINEFGLKRLGFHMFREWPSNSTVQRVDIDSGPIIWGAGVTATGVALATARAVVDYETVRDVADLAIKLGFPNTWQDAKGNSAKWHLGGWLTVGDAFQAWGWSIAAGSDTPAMAKLWPSGGRFTFHVAAFGLVALLLSQWYFAVWRFRRRWKMTVGEGIKFPPAESTRPLK